MLPGLIEAQGEFGSGAVVMGMQGACWRRGGRVLRTSSCSSVARLAADLLSAYLKYMGNIMAVPEVVLYKYEIDKLYRLKNLLRMKKLEFRGFPNLSYLCFVCSRFQLLSSTCISTFAL